MWVLPHVHDGQSCPSKCSKDNKNQEVERQLPGSIGSALEKLSDDLESNPIAMPKKGSIARAT